MWCRAAFVSFAALMCARLYQAAEGHWLLLLAKDVGGSTSGRKGKIKDVGEESSKTRFSLNLEETFQIRVLDFKRGSRREEKTE